MSFSSLGLSAPLLRAVNDSGYITPTPIQIESIPAVLSGKDVMAAAQTGTGKTAGFILPLLQRLDGGTRVRSNHIRALVLTPTRELAIQVGQSVATYGRYLSLKSGVVYGGVKINPQMMKLRSGVDVLVATPGRLLDLFSQNAMKFAQVEILVLDEADRMLDMGFIGDIRKILALLPKKRQNLLFSATFSSDIRILTDVLLDRPVQIEVSPRNAAAESVKQWVYEVDKGKKTALLSHLIRSNGWEQVLVFTRTKIGADRLVTILNRDGVCAAAIHGDKSQGVRTRVLADFKANKIHVLVATDIAARGIDIGGLPQVINFELPKVSGDYIHRIGRTGRAGLQGEGISLVCADEVPLLSGIEGLIQQTLVRQVATGFVPTQQVPMSSQVKARPKKPKKPKLKRDQVGNTGDGQKSAGSKLHDAAATRGAIGCREQDNHSHGAAAGKKKSPAQYSRRGANKYNPDKPR